jgi:carbon monoxide dehydrogenase subunit G
VRGRFEGTTTIDRPIEQVFAFLADGENDPKFSPRVIEIAKRTDGPPGVGTIYASTVKDAGMRSKREFELTEFDSPVRIRWREISKNLVTAPEGGYDLLAEGNRTRLTVFNVLEGTGRRRVGRPFRSQRRAQGRRPLREPDQGGGRGRHAAELIGS